MIQETMTTREAMTSEETIWKSTPSQIIHLPLLLLGAIIATAISAGLGLLVGPAVPVYLAIIAVVWFVCLLPWLWKSLNTKFYNYALTNERLKLTTGIFSRDTDVLELYRVKDMAISQPFLLRIFGLSNVTLTTSDRTTPILKLEAIRDGEKVLDTIRAHVEALREKKRVREVDFEGDDASDFDDI
ncbi:MAG: PH domain-containing protein [Verrucomicrobiales bacterium]